MEKKIDKKFLNVIKKSLKEGQSVDIDDEYFKQHGTTSDEVKKYLEKEGIPYRVEKGKILPVGPEDEEDASAKDKVIKLAMVFSVIALVGMIALGIMVFTADKQPDIAQIKTMKAEFSNFINKTKSEIKKLTENLNSAVADISKRVKVIEKTTKTAVSEPPQKTVPIGMAFVMQSNAMVTEEGVDPKYWSVTFKGVEADGKKVTDPTVYKKYADSIKKEGRKKADEYIRKEMASSEEPTKFVVANLDKSGKESFIRNIDTVLFKLNAQSHWAWDKELGAWTTADPNAISPILISNFNIQAKAKVKRVDIRCTKLKAEFER